MSEPPTAHNGDVYVRIGKLETSVGRLETNVQIIHDQISKVGANVEKLATNQMASGRTNWGVLIAAGGLVFAIGGAVLTAAVLPLRVIDVVHDKEIAELRAQMRADHDYVVRLQERELIRREMGK